MRHRRGPPPLPAPDGLCPLSDVETVSRALLGGRAADLGDVLGAYSRFAGPEGFAGGPVPPRLARLARLAALATLEAPRHRASPEPAEVPTYARSRLPARVAGIDAGGPALPAAAARVVDAALAESAGPGEAVFGRWTAPWLSLGDR